MLEDKLVVIISDTGVFMVTPLENSKKYEEEFHHVNVEGREAYGIQFKEGILVSNG